MDLVLWRHAEAQEWVEGCHDPSRALTPKGEKQAARMASWLDRHLPDGAKVLVSPALRAEQTAMALGRKYKIKPELAVEASGAVAKCQRRCADRGPPTGPWANCRPFAGH